jgi:hypothetical protein
MVIDKQKIDVIVVIPIGPGSQIDFVMDTISSYKFFANSSYKFILADDSHQNIGAAIQKKLHDCDVLCTLRPMGGWAGLYINLCNAYKHALENYDFKAILKLDTDALIIGTNPEKEALQLFEKNPFAGIAGQYPYTYDGEPWNIRWPEQRIINSTRSWKFFRRPFANFSLIKYYNNALKNGYKTGESVFGGAYFISRNCIAALNEDGLLPEYKFQSLNLGEDHIFSLLTKSIGYTLESLSTNGPMGCSWNGLPVPPEQLIIDGKKIIHSTKYWENLDESAIRMIFKSYREKFEIILD